MPLTATDLRESMPARAYAVAIDGDASVAALALEQARAWLIAQHAARGLREAEIDEEHPTIRTALLMRAQYALYAHGENDLIAEDKRTEAAALLRQYLDRRLDGEGPADSISRPAATVAPPREPSFREAFQRTTRGWQHRP